MEVITVYVPPHFTFTPFASLQSITQSAASCSTSQNSLIQLLLQSYRCFILVPVSVFSFYSSNLPSFCCPSVCFASKWQIALMGF